MNLLAALHKSFTTSWYNGGAMVEEWDSVTLHGKGIKPVSFWFALRLGIEEGKR